MSASISKRAALGGSISLLALMAATSGSVQAQTVISYIAPSDLSIAGDNAANTVNDILSSLTASSSAVSATTTSNVIDANSAVVGSGDENSIDVDANSLYAISRGTQQVNRIGVLATDPGDVVADGAAIFAFASTSDIDATASATGNDITDDVTGAASPVLTFDGNSITSEGSYNRAASTIEVVIPADLQVPADPASLEQVVDTSLLQQGTLNLLNLQTNSAYAASGTDTAVTAGNDIALLRNLEAATSYGGSVSAIENEIGAEANGNTSDNSVFVRQEFGGETGSNSFSGTVAVGNAQLNQQVDDDGIDAVATSASISATFGDTSDGLGGSVASAEALSLEMDGNVIASSTALNRSRQEINFDGSMILEGPATLLDGAPGDVDAQSVFVDGGPVLAAYGDYVAINQQTAERDAPTTPATDPGTIATATTGGADVTLLIEDVAGDTQVSFDGNAISSSVTGNRGSNLIGNVLPDSGDGPSTGVEATIVSANSQYVLEPELFASTSGATLEVAIGNAGGTGVGGFEGSSLSVAGNGIQAAATGNGGSSLVDFEAVSITTAYDTGATTNGTATVDADRGTSSGVFDNRILAGTSVINHQVTDNFASPYQYTDPSVEASLTGSSIEVTVNAGDATNGAGLSGSVFEVLENQLSSVASGNVFQSLTRFGADAGFTGSIGTLSVQADTGQNMTATTSGANLLVNLDAADDAAAVEDLSLDVSGNGVLAFSTISSLGTVSAVEAGSFLGGAATNGDPVGAVFGSQNAVGGQEVLRYSSLAQAGVATVSDQSNYDGDSVASSSGNAITVDLANAYDGVLSDVAAAVTLNTMGAQSRGNEAANSIVLDIATTLAVEGGEAAIAGIVSVQANSHVEATTTVPLTGAGTVIQANADGNVVNTTTPGLENASLEVLGNRVLANAIGNSTTNSLSVEALSLAGFAGSTLEIAPIAAAAGQDLLADSSLFIVNSQRSEPNLTTDGGGIADDLGPTVNASMGGNSILTTVGEDATNASIAVEGNALLATARSNDTLNSISVSQGSGTFSAGILSHQGASGDMTASNGGASVSLTLSGLGTPTAAANLDTAVTMDGNQIGSSLTGNNAGNVLSAEGATGFSAIGGGFATVSGGATADSNGASEAFGDLAVLNSQRYYGAEDDAAALNSSTSGSSVTLNVPGGLENGSASLSGNSVQASATVNAASNLIQASAGTGGLPSASLVNQQSAADVAVSSLVAGNSIAATIGGASGTLLSGSATISGNSIGSSATINGGSNTIGGVGQSFTRTASF